MLQCSVVFLASPIFLALVQGQYMPVTFKLLCQQNRKIYESKKAIKMVVTHVIFQINCKN